MSGYSDQWMQFYDQISMDDDHVASSMAVPASDGLAAAVMTSCSVSDHHHHAHHPLSPKGCVSKPLRRRSRASKKTPTTLLSADANNFRSLVQQFTGCPTTAGFSYGSKKGPITLNFKLGHNQQQQHMIDDGIKVAASSVATKYNGDDSKSSYYDCDQQQLEISQGHHHHHHQCFASSFDHDVVANDAIFEAATNHGGNPNPNGFPVDDMFHDVSSNNALYGESRKW